MRIFIGLKGDKAIAAQTADECRAKLPGCRVIKQNMKINVFVGLIAYSDEGLPETFVHIGASGSGAEAQMAAHADRHGIDYAADGLPHSLQAFQL